MTDYRIAPAQAIQLLAIAEMLREGDLVFRGDNIEDVQNARAALIDVSQEIALQHIGMPGSPGPNLNQKLNTTFKLDDEPTENIMDDYSGAAAGRKAADMYDRDQAHIQRAADKGPSNTLRNAGPLQAIFDHIMRAANQMVEIGYKLNEHADAVHGPVPETTVNGTEHGVPDSALQKLFYALDRLDEAHRHVAEAAGRNCTLA